MNKVDKRQTPKRVPKLCPDCGVVYMGTHSQKRCHECGIALNHKWNQTQSAAEKERRMHKICIACGKEFIHQGPKSYCPECDTPEAKRLRESDRARARRKAERDHEAEIQRESKAKRKRKKLVADLVSGARTPQNNHEAIIRIEALGRIHGGAWGSYGKEAAGFYESTEERK